MQTVTQAVGPTQIARQILVVPNQVFDFLNRARQRASTVLGGQVGEHYLP
jgi:hypothetical protein